MFELPTVDSYIDKSQHWKGELMLLRSLMLSYGLEETIKWQRPTYTKNGKNLIGLAAFKEYVGIWFFQGGLLEDKEQKLVNVQEGKTKAMRHWKFKTMDEISTQKTLILSYIEETIANHDAGKKIKTTKNNKAIIIPPELSNTLETNLILNKNFQKLSPSAQREYAEYISEAKRESTKERRLIKITALILEGKSLNDQYKK